MAGEEPVWKRIVGGLIGLLLLAALIFLARSRGVSGEQVEAWQELIVVAAAGAGLLGFWYMRRKG